MKRIFTSLIASVALLGASFTATADDKPLTKADVEAIVKQVIKDNPALILQVINNYENKEVLERVSEAAKNITRKREEIQHDPHSPSIGNPKADVTITEFFDYHCGYCKRFYPELSKLMSEDKNVRVVFKEFPILSEDSVEAARAALAVWRLDPSKYFQYHTLLMQESGAFTPDLLAEKAKAVGIDPQALKTTMADPSIDRDLASNRVLADSLTINATPAILINSEFMPGAMSYPDLLAKVKEAREIEQHEGMQKGEN